jgi:GNAT superfamily N-acetyltransferase
VSARARLRFRPAGAEDAASVAWLHAESWRRHYRGAYSDAFLDGDVLADRVALWSRLLREGDAGRHTVLAEEPGLVGFAHVVFDEDRRWGALLENLHVARGHQRLGVGSRLLALSAAAVAAHGGRGLYLWVLEQNRDAQAFYTSRGGRLSGREPVTPPGGVAGRLAGKPWKLRYVWPDVAALL